ncbi:hypothetical protein QAD02_017638 [Eretmocerus hayati]|uniref:Uncharacterized protein n=1 Tax=Eretmocerus hayati TaxID=131215 RepID=A0ACC2PEF7_9HYME|nr:hypothetical protein QAD02_017638 [Eretmocerus hayati]
MSVFDTNDLKSELHNLTLITSEEPMETSTSSTKQAPRKSILKSPSQSFKENDFKKDMQDELLNSSSSYIARPHTVDELVKKGTLTPELELQSTFNLENLDQDEELWVIDIPGTINPLQLKGQSLQLGEKSKFKVGEERYCASNRGSKSSLTCVFKTNDESRMYKTVNIKPSGILSIRRKLSGTSKKKVQFETSTAVPYPKNIKLRHPFFGVHVDNSAVKVESRC